MYLGSCKGSMRRKGIRVFMHEERAVGLWAGSDLGIQGLAFRSLSKSIDCVILLFIRFFGTKDANQRKLERLVAPKCQPTLP